jgi:hypothetical protein
MKTLTEAKKLRIHHWEPIRAAYDATIAAERALLRLQHISPLRPEPDNAPQGLNGESSRKRRERRPAAGQTRVSSRRQIVKRLEENARRDFDAQTSRARPESSNETLTVASPRDSLLARLHQEGKSTSPPSAATALPPFKRAKSNETE